MNRLVALLLWAGGATLGATACSRHAEPPPAARVPGAALDRAEALATLPEEAPPPAPAPAQALGLGLHPAATASGPEYQFSALGGGVAWAAEREGKLQVFHNGRPGKAYAAVGAIALSPDGRRCAHGALLDGRWRMVVDGVEGEPFSAVKDPVFSPDGAHLAYQAMAGEKWVLVVDGKANAGTTTHYLRHEFNRDSDRIAYLEEAGPDGQRKLYVSDLGFAKPVRVGGHVVHLTLDSERTRIAAIDEDGAGQRVLTLAFDRPDQVHVGRTEDNVFGLAFAPGGGVTYRAARGSTAFVVLGDRSEPQPFRTVVDQVAQPGGKAVGGLVVAGEEVRYHTFFVPGASEEGPYEEAEGLTFSADGRFHAYAARKGATWSLVVNGKAGPPFDRVVSPRFSPDGKFVAYRARQDGRRFVVVADTEGRTIRRHPSYEQVFPVLFTADGRSVAYGVKDGRQLAWKVEGL